MAVSKQLPGGLYLCNAILKSNRQLFTKTIKMIRVGDKS
jgi:hypothetical protein